MFDVKLAISIALHCAYTAAHSGRRKRQVMLPGSIKTYASAAASRDEEGITCGLAKSLGFTEQRIQFMLDSGRNASTQGAFT
ncbi:hypothetical protein OH492_26705 [Vibrio chagasii]|nr:hypothetical protein [Vibrio chagasii]